MNARLKSPLGSLTGSLFQMKLNKNVVVSAFLSVAIFGGNAAEAYRPDPHRGYRIVLPDGTSAPASATGTITAQVGMDHDINRRVLVVGVDFGGLDQAGIQSEITNKLQTVAWNDSDVHVRTNPGWHFSYVGARKEFLVTYLENALEPRNVRKVDFGNAAFDKTLALSAVIPRDTSGEGYWGLSFGAEPNSPGQTLVADSSRLELPGSQMFTALVGAGATPADCAQSMFATLTSAGFDAQLVGTNLVTFSRDGSGELIKSIEAFSGPQNIHIGLEMPVPTPGSIALVGTAGLFACRRRRST